MKDPVLEVCVDSTASALAAKQGGASRLELCADLVIGGTTPSLALVRQVKAETGLPVRALLRPRFGDFCYDRYELDQMTQQAAALVEAGADGIVTGVLTPEGDLDTAGWLHRQAAKQAAQQTGRPVALALHRAFDVCRDPFAALETACQLGFDTILTERPGRQRRSRCIADRCAGTPCGRTHRDPGRCGHHTGQPPCSGQSHRCSRLPSLRQKGTGQPDAVPPGGRPHGTAGLFRICGLADRPGHHPPGTTSTGTDPIKQQGCLFCGRPCCFCYANWLIYSAAYLPFFFISSS